MTDRPTLTEAAIGRLARAKSYDRGENYYERGAVIDATARGNRLQATVEGSQYEPYHVQIELDTTGVVDTACSCPYDHGGICKHRVAVLLAYVRDPDAIDQRPPIAELVANADAATLREVVETLVDRHPELATVVESHLTVENEDTTEGAQDHTPAVDRESIRQRVQHILRPTKGKPAHAHGPYAAAETDVERLRDVLDQAQRAIDAGDGAAALDILEPLADELMDEAWLALSYDDSNGIFEFFDEVDRLLAAALLTADRSEPERADWEERLGQWKDEMGRYTHHPPYSVALKAVQRGWDFEPLQRAMREDGSEADLWDGDPPWYAEDYIRIRLDILERQDRIEEYLNLAAAADLIDAYVTKLVEEGQTDEAIEYGHQHIDSPDDALTLARVLRNHDRPQAALAIAQHGLTLDGNGNAELAQWLRDRASSLGDHAIALEAAIAAFDASPTLSAYRAAEDLVDTEWPTVREQLLTSLADQNTTQRSALRHVEILLYAARYDEAIAIADRFSDAEVRKQVTEEVWNEYPQWTIDACKAQAEPIIEEGRSKQYRQAVQWLETAGKAAQAADELDEWRSYVEDIREEHYRKYKLRPMLEELLEAFEGQ